MVLRYILSGLLSYVPVLRRRILRHRTGGTGSARYCYSVWLRHLVWAHRNGLNAAPVTVAELGPGDSLGIGLAALLSGAERYWAFDVVRYADTGENLGVFNELVDLFCARADIPGPDEFPMLLPLLDDYRFPSDLLTDERLDAALADMRLDRIRRSIVTADGSADSMIEYRVPWSDAIAPGTVDMIYSQAVLEHIDDLAGAYRAMHQWLAEGGFVSHQIDLKCHGIGDRWNSHWTYSDLVWRLIRGNRAYLLNRQPCSVHLEHMRQVGLDLVSDRRVIDFDSGWEQCDLPERYQHGLWADDFFTTDVFIQALKGQVPQAELEPIVTSEAVDLDAEQVEAIMHELRKANRR